MKKIKIIVALTLNKGIGYKNNLLYEIPEDIKFFKKITNNCVVIMGSKTYNSIPKKFRPLKNRINIILSFKKEKYKNEDVMVVSSIKSALKKATNFSKKEIYIIGGASVYQKILPLVSKLKITQIFETKKADTFFPNFKNDFKCIFKSPKKISLKNQVAFQFQTWERKQ